MGTDRKRWKWRICFQHLSVRIRVIRVENPEFESLYVGLGGPRRLDRPLPDFENLAVLHRCATILAHVRP